jgi:hypothetical protein
VANVNKGHGIWVLDIMGGCPMVVDHKQPHLGGNMDGGNESTEFSKDLFPWLVKTFQITSLIDVGCGQGHALRAFKSLGVEKVIGIEGLVYNAEKCGVPVIVHDLTKGPCLFNGYDFVWCSDVAEHIEEQYVGNLLATLANGKIIAMAQGDQDMVNTGWHHVNNKPESYWIEKMASVGLVTNEDLTQQARAQSKLGIWPKLGRIYINKYK